LDLAADARPLDRRVVITALGIAQILAWGTSFYFPAVFAEPIVAETGWSLGVVVGGTSIGLLTAGLISPQVGRAVGGRASARGKARERDHRRLDRVRVDQCGADRSTVVALPKTVIQCCSVPRWSADCQGSL